MLVIETTLTVWNTEKEEFDDIVVSTLEFEHSLASLSKWESKWEVPFISKTEKKTTEQVYDYISFMCLTPGVTREQILGLSEANFNKINDYIDSQQTATKFAELPDRKVKNERVTAELIYYWMVAFRIPWEAQHWHLSKLLALIRVCNSKQNTKQKKMSAHEVAQRNRELNEQRRQEYNTRG